MYNKKKGK